MTTHTSAGRNCPYVLSNKPQPSAGYIKKLDSCTPGLLLIVSISGVQNPGHVPGVYPDLEPCTHGVGELPGGFSLLHLAAGTDQPDSVTWLVQQQGVDVNSAYPPLHSGCPMTYDLRPEA